MDSVIEVTYCPDCHGVCVFEFSTSKKINYCVCEVFDDSETSESA